MTRSADWHTPDIDTFDTEDLSPYEQRQLESQPPPRIKGQWNRKHFEPEPKIVTLADVKR